MQSFRSFSEKKTLDTFDLDDLDVVKYKPGEDKFTNRNANKRKKADVEEKNDPCLDSYEIVETENVEKLDEILNVAQRRKRGIIAKRNKSKLKRGRIKASKRIADKDRLNNRARRQAKADIVKKLTKGVSKGELSPQRRAEVERRLEKMKGRVERNQKKLIPTVRKRDRDMI